MSISTLNEAGQVVPVELWSPLDQVEKEAQEQLVKVAKLPWVFHHVAVMPDVHAGKGCTVGSVIAMKSALAPAAVGVDIGCGMGAVRTSLTSRDLPDNLEPLRAAIEAAIPVGHHQHLERGFQDWMPDDLKYDILRELISFYDLRAPVHSDQVTQDRTLKQLGTLGGGNHFIEVCLDTDDRVWLMLHSGSRYVGKALAERHIEVAKRLAHNEDIPDMDMAVFLAGTPQMEAYRYDLMWAQKYAMLNRRVMFELLKSAVEDALMPHRAAQGIPDITYDDAILCHHNYVSEETHFGENVYVTRKGAIRAGRGDMGIIPGSMGTRSYIVRGLGNADSFQSASHGAGRKMSRGKAKRTFTLADLAEQTKGVCCRKDADIIDEIPGSYKDIDQVMKNQKDLVEIVHTLKQVLCVKG